MLIKAEPTSHNSLKHHPQAHDSDSYDELSGDELQTSKKPKTETRLVSGRSPNKRAKPARTSAPKCAWTKEEEEAFMDCLQSIITAHMRQAIKDFPQVAGRTSDGCIKHWNAIRRKHEAAVLGAATINRNGKKLPKLGTDKLE